MGRENIIHAGLSNVDLLLGDARRLIMRDACVDIVLSGRNKKKKKKGEIPTGPSPKFFILRKQTGHGACAKARMPKSKR